LADQSAVEFLVENSLCQCSFTIGVNQWREVTKMMHYIPYK